jgi:hypothetical protein
MCKVNVRQSVCNSLIQDWGVTGRFSHGTQQNIIEMKVAEKIKKKGKTRTEGNATSGGYCSHF